MALMNEEFEFSLDDLVVEDQEVLPPIVLQISVFVSETEYAEQEEDVRKLAVDIEKQLTNDYPFSKSDRRKYKEGFLAFECSENCLKCIYAREVPTRIDFELDDLKIHTKRIRYIGPSYRVKIIISIDKTKTRVVLFGGDNRISAKALGLVNICIRKCLRGGHKTYETRFSQEAMHTMLENFGEHVQYVYIAPGDNERLRRIVERREKGVVKKIRLYSVYTKFAGYRITVSPIVMELIKEEGIRIREIEGRFDFIPGFPITARVSINGRILFFIPPKLIGKSETVYDVAEQLYIKIITQRAGAKQITMEEFFPGAS